MKKLVLIIALVLPATPTLAEEGTQDTIQLTCALMAFFAKQAMESRQQGIPMVEKMGEVDISTFDDSDEQKILAKGLDDMRRKVVLAAYHMPVSTLR